MPLLSLPDEIILCVARLLHLPDLRRLRLVSRRVFNIVASIRGVKPAVLNFPKDVDSDSLCEREEALDQDHVRALLLRVDSRDVLKELDKPTQQSSDRLRLLQRLPHVECLSLASGSTLMGYKSNFKFRRILNTLSLLPSYQSSLTHLECVGFKVNGVNLRDAFPVLVDVSFCMPPDAHHYTLEEGRNIILELESHNIVSFTISLADSSTLLLRLCIKQWQRLRSLSFCSDSVLQQPFLLSHFALNRQDSCEGNLESHLYLEHLSMTNSPIKVIASEIDVVSRKIGGGPVRFFGPHGMKTEVRDIYDVEVVGVTKEIAAFFPALKLVSWLVPIQKRKSRVWCRLQGVDWESKTDQDCWPETDMDVVFS